MTSLQLQPVGVSERIELLDVLRGFALLGILLVNFHGDPGSLMPAVDALTASILAAFVSESFYPLFSFLFGVGFAVQLARARSRGAGVSRLYIRRMLILFLIGTCHSIFIWGGDILVRYAIAGLVLIPLHRVPQKAVLAIAGVLLISILNGETLRTVAESSSGTGRAVELASSAAVGTAGPAANQAALAREGGDSSYVLTSISRSKDWLAQVRGHGKWLTWALNDVLFCFMIGFVAGRSRLLHEAGTRRRTLVMIATVAFVFAAGGILSMALLELAPGFLRSVAWHAENFGMTALYISGIALLFTLTTGPRRVLSVFAMPGRMGLTNYLSQSFVMTWMSMSYGFGWRPGTTLWVSLNLLFFFGVQVPLSRWWLARYQYGPAEWLWRSITYGAAQPMRLQPSTVPIGPIPSVSATAPRAE